MTDYRHELKRFPRLVHPPESRVKEPREGGVYVALPQGKRVFAWFTYCKSKNICFIVDGGMIYPVHAAFPTRLALGTIVSGILAQRVLTVDTVLLEAGQTCCDLDKVMHQLECPVYLPTQMTFQRAATSLIPFFDAPYKIQCVKCIHGAAVTIYDEKYATFQISALPTSDAYEVRDTQGRSCLALVDSYTRSVAMNKLFRTIHENSDLDLGEESDEEELPIGPPLRMECRWHFKHKQWVPVECC